MIKRVKDKLVSESEVAREMRRIGVEPMGIKIMKDKSKFRIIRLTNIRAPLANIIKEGMLSAGGDAAVHRLTCACKVKFTDVLLMGTVTQYRRLTEKLRLQPFGGKGVVRRIRDIGKMGRN